MAIYSNKIYSTRWPLIDFFLKIWKLQAGIVLMSPSMESMSYHYVALILHWGDKQLFNFRLYDTEKRKMNLFDLNKHEPYTIKEIEEIKKIANKELKRLKNQPK